MTDQNETLFCEACGEMTRHHIVELKPLQAADDATLLQRAGVAISNSLDLLLGSQYRECSKCGCTFGQSDSLSGF